MFNREFVERTALLSTLVQIADQTAVMASELKVEISALTKQSSLKFLYFCLLSVCLAAPPAHAVLLVDWVYNVDGAISDSYYGDPDPTTGALSDGLGVLSMEITGAGAHNAIGYFDFEIVRATNTFYNESGQATGTPGNGQSWEIDEPGLVFGNLLDNVYYGELDNSNSMPAGMEEDLSFAMGWDFSLLEDDVATINYIFTDVMPTAGFFLTQIDPDAAYEFYFYSELSIQTAGEPSGPIPDPVPEPATAMLMAAGLLTAWSQRRRITGSEDKSGNASDS